MIFSALLAVVDGFVTLFLSIDNFNTPLSLFLQQRFFFIM